MLSESQHFFQSVRENGIEGSFAGSEGSSVSYGTLETTKEDFKLFSFMLQSPLKWLDLGYLKLIAMSTYVPTEKVEADRHILIRIMEKHLKDSE